MCENPVEQQVLLRIQYGLNQPHEMHAVRSKIVVDLGAGGPAPGARGQAAGVLPCPPDWERPLGPHNPARQGAAAATPHHSSSRRPTPSILVRQHHRRPTSRTTTMALTTDLTNHNHGALGQNPSSMARACIPETRLQLTVCFRMKYAIKSHL